MGGEEVYAERLASRDACYFVVEERRLPVGTVILCGLDSNNRCIELKRVVVSRPGQGLGRRALELVLEMVFTELAAHRLWLDIYMDNERARRTYRALGFVEEGTMRECIWQGGRFRSLVLMAMLEGEFRGK
ncbi:MAG: GNAT family protein [Acidobacteria bacterium]|nr:GNAT family protein [Acidobacteriota bacterium]